MSSSPSAGGGGIGFAGMLTILFIALKLTGNITWSWLWVLSPLWISFGIAIGLIIIVLIIAAIAAVASS